MKYCIGLKVTGHPVFNENENPSLYPVIQFHFHSPALETFTLTLGKTMGGLGVPLFEAEDLVARTIVVDLRRLWGVHSWKREGRGIT